MKRITNGCGNQIRQHARGNRRALALFLALAMVVSLGVDIGSITTTAYANETISEQIVDTSDSSNENTGDGSEDAIELTSLEDGEPEIPEEAVEVVSEDDSDPDPDVPDDDNDVEEPADESDETDTDADVEETTAEDDDVADPDKDEVVEEEDPEENDDTLSNSDYDADYIQAAEEAVSDIDDNDHATVLVAVALSQIGYKEQIKDDTDSDVYTLYAHEYYEGNNDSHAWNTTFAMWALGKAGFETSSSSDDSDSEALPVRSDLSAWIKAVKAHDYYINVTDDVADLAKADIAFLDLDGDETADHVGIVTNTKTDDDALVAFNAVIADLDAETLSYYADDVDADTPDAVALVTFSGEDYGDAADEYLGQIVTGYVDISSYVDALDADEETGDEEDIEYIHTRFPWDEISGTTYTDITENTAHTNEIMLMDLGDDDYGIATIDDTTTTGVDLNGYLTSASFQKKNGVIWEESTEFTTADQVRGTINFENVYTSTIKNNGNTLYIDLPAYINCSSFTGTYDTYDGSTHSGKYHYEKNADGTYRIVLKLDDDYVNNAGDTIGGSLQFNFTWTKEAVDSSGTKKVEIGNWSGDLKIKEDSSGDDKPSSANYTIYKQAGGLQIDSDGYAYIDYTVTLTVKNGMTAPINLKDVLTGTGFTYVGGSLSISGGDVKANFGSTYGQGTSTQIQIYPNSGTTVDPGTYTIKYRVKSLNSVIDPDTKLSSEIKNTITVPEDGDDSISSETHTSTTSGVINKQGQLVSGSDATYIDYTVYLNAGDIIKNLKTPANFTDTLPNALELQGDVTVKQYDVSGNLQSTTTATVDGQNISYTTPTGQYYYVITYRAKVKDSDLPIGGSVTIKNDGKSTGGVDGSSSSEITVTNHKLTKRFVSQNVTKNETDGKWYDIIKWSSTIAVKGSLDGYVYEDWAGLWDYGTPYSPMTMTDEQRKAIVVKDSSGNVVDSGKYTVTKSDHSDSGVSNGLYKITFTSDVKGPVTIEYETTVDMSQFTVGGQVSSFVNYASLTKDGHTDKAQAQTDSFQYRHDFKEIIHKYGKDYVTSESIKITLEPGQTTIPWSIQVNEGRSLYTDLVITDTIAEGLTYVEGSLTVSGLNTGTSAETSYDASTRTITIKIPANAYSSTAESNKFSNAVTITYRTELPSSFFSGSGTTGTFSNTASVKYDGEIKDSTFDQDVTRQVVGKNGNYDKNTKLLSYNVIINPDGSTLNGGNNLTVIDTLDAGTIADSVSLQSLELFTALKTTDSKGDVTVEPGKLVQELTQATSGTEVFTYTLDETGKTFTTYLPDSNAYVIVAKYYVDLDVSADVYMKNTVKIVGNEDWKKEDSSTKVENGTSGETHTNKVVIVKRDTAQYSKLLPGATFELDVYEKQAWSKFGELTTDANGTASFNEVSFYSLYKISETAAPAGYVVDGGPLYFCIIDPSGDIEAARKILPASIAGDSNYSRDAVKFYTSNTFGQDRKYINITIDRYNSVDTSKVNPGELRVNKVWVDANGNTVTDVTELSKMQDVSVTLTKHVPVGNPTVTISTPDGSHKWSKTVNKGATITLYANPYGGEGISGNTEEEKFTYLKNNTSIKDSSGNDITIENWSYQTIEGNTRWEVTIGPINESCTISNMRLAWDDDGTKFKSEGGTAATGTEDTVIGTVTLNAANDWTYLWTNLDRTTTGVTYTITEQTVSGYTVKYQINGKDLAAGETFTPAESGDKVTVTNTANPVYELPSTGGTGTLLTYMLGCLAILMSMFAGYSTWRSGERRAR